MTRSAFPRYTIISGTAYAEVDFAGQENAGKLHLRVGNVRYVVIPASDITYPSIGGLVIYQNPLLNVLTPKKCCER